MQKFVTNIALFTRCNLTTFSIILLTTLLFSAFSSFAIEEKSGLSRLWIGLTSLFVGVSAGGLLGFIVGGVGVAAMGTAVGIPAAAMAGLGALFGGVVFGSIGTGIGAYLSNPARFEVNQWMLAAILFASMSASVLLVHGAKRLILWAVSRGFFHTSRPPI